MDAGREEQMLPDPAAELPPGAKTIELSCDGERSE
jgi:hypothetical protein